MEKPLRIILIRGTLANGSAIVYKNNAALTLPGGVPPISIGFNGDDAVALYKISTSSYVIFGRIGEDPGTVGEQGIWSRLKNFSQKSICSWWSNKQPCFWFPYSYN